MTKAYARLTILAVAVAVAAIIALTWPRARSDWEAFRHDAMRSAEQPVYSALADPAKVRNLRVVRQTMPVPRARTRCRDNSGTEIPCPASRQIPLFRASPIVSRGKLYIGSTNGRMYAYDASALNLLWEYPPATAGPAPPLQNVFTCDNSAGIPSSYGIAASATIAIVQNKRAVVFAGPDSEGQGRLFALNADTGESIWKEPPVIARRTGWTRGVDGELHEKTGYSAPIVVNRRVYIGINDHCDNPIQKGRVVAVDLNTGAIAQGFGFCSVGHCTDDLRGGGVWSSVAALNDDLFVTTGNTNRDPGNPFVEPEPTPNYGLSLLRLNGATGAVRWAFQPVPYLLDQDPDWAATPTVMPASCGTLVVSTQKDGWTYALDQYSSLRWAFPPRPAAPVIPGSKPSKHLFAVGDGTFHSDSQFKRPGAAWGNVYVTTTAGVQASTADMMHGARRLYAFDVCSTRWAPVRWIADVWVDVEGVKLVPDECKNPKPVVPIPGELFGGLLRNCLGPPTVTGGVFFVGTAAGYLVVIGDPSLPGVRSKSRCVDVRLDPVGCKLLRLPLVAEPEILTYVRLDGTPILTEPVLVDGRVYVATDRGTIYMLEP